jgi:hypothetical protein
MTDEMNVQGFVCCCREPLTIRLCLQTSRHSGVSRKCASEAGSRRRAWLANSASAKDGFASGGQRPGGERTLDRENIEWIGARPSIGISFHFIGWRWLLRSFPWKRQALRLHQLRYRGIASLLLLSLET